MIWSFLFLNAGLVVLTARIRFDSGGLAYAGPVPMSPAAWWWLGGGLVGTGLLAAILDRKRLAQPGVPRALLELSLVFTSLFAYIWAVYPDRGHGLRDYPSIAIFVAILGCCSISAFREPAAHGLTARNFKSALQCLMVPTAVMAALPIAALPLTGGEFRSDLALSRVGKYCGWGLAQLFLFQVFLVPRLSKLSSSVRQIIAVAAGVFALVHWPNPTLMTACAVAGAVWTAVFIRHPNLYALNLSMVLAVAVFSAALSGTILRNARIGPSYVEVPPIAAHHDDVVRELSSDAYFAEHGGNNRDFVIALYADILDRKADPNDPDGWVRDLETGTATRAEVVQRLMDCDEMLKRLKSGPVRIHGRAVMW
jgi:hypothetical protein